MMGHDRDQHHNQSRIYSARGNWNWLREERDGKATKITMNATNEAQHKVKT